MISPRVIILNGVSSAGKTSLARAIQHHAKLTLLHVEMDAFISFLPNGHEFKPEWFRLDRVDSQFGKLPRISNGQRGAALLGVMRNFVIEAAKSGLDLVVDEVCHAKEVTEYRAGIPDAQIVKVFAPLAVIEQREKARGDRLIGLAREQSMHLHDRIDYDAEVDTSVATPQELAAQLLEAFNT